VITLDLEEAKILERYILFVLTNIKKFIKTGGKNI